MQWRKDNSELQKKKKLYQLKFYSDELQIFLKNDWPCVMKNVGFCFISGKRTTKTI